MGGVGGELGGAFSFSTAPTTGEPGLGNGLLGEELASGSNWLLRTGCGSSERGIDGIGNSL